MRFISKFRREDHVGSTSETVRRLSAMVKKLCYSSRRGSSHGTNIPEISGKFNLHGESGDMTSDGARKSGNKAHGLASKLAIGLILLAGGLTPANAQTGTGSPGTPQTGGGMMGGGHGGRHRNQQQNGQPAPALAPLPVVKEPWPRLDSGAIVCKSRDDLLRYQTGSGAASTGPAPDCHSDTRPGWSFACPCRHDGRCETNRMDERLSVIRTSTIRHHTNCCEALNVADHDTGMVRLSA